MFLIPCLNNIIKGFQNYIRGFSKIFFKNHQSRYRGFCKSSLCHSKLFFFSPLSNPFKQCLKNHIQIIGKHKIGKPFEINKRSLQRALILRERKDLPNLKTIFTNFTLISPSDGYTKTCSLGSMSPHHHHCMPQYELLDYNIP